MKRIIIICEGPTEKEFCEKMLSLYFEKRGICIQPPLIKRSNGGIVKWSELKKQIEIHLKQEKGVYVSLLIDYYGIDQKYQFPNWEESLKIVNKNERMGFLEQSMKEDIDPDLRFRFIPYIQLHEFEGLLFNDIEMFYRLFDKKEIVGEAELKETFSLFSDNPEMINDSEETAPSKRLKRIIKGYDKVVYGNIMVESIGLTNIRSKSPRFNEWLNKIEFIADI